MVGLSAPGLQRSAGGARRAHPAARQRTSRRRRGGAWPGHSGDCQCRVRCARCARSQPAAHPRPPDRGDGIDGLTALHILSGGAAQGLVASLATRFKELTGLGIAGEFGAVGAMADKLRSGTQADIVVLTAAIIADLDRENLVVGASISDIGLVETAVAVRAGDPQVTANDSAAMREGWAGAEAMLVMR